MGIYLNPGNEKFLEAVQSPIYVDKTGLIQYTNSVVQTLQKYVCVSRPRRFGKSMAANMLTAYYSKGCDSRKLFAGLKIAESENFNRYLNRYQVLFLNMQEFLSNSANIEDMIEYTKEELLGEVLIEIKRFDRAYVPSGRNTLNKALHYLYEKSGQAFVIIIDEWDCVLREYKEDKSGQALYLDFLRDMLKDKGYIHLVYMTGILPIKKYGTHSALNMFDEFSMTYAGPLASYAGFTENEVRVLCERYSMDFLEEQCWYDGYVLKNCGHVYSPRSVVSSMQFGNYGNYWNQTETFEALRLYIDMNFEGLKDDVLLMMAGTSVPVNTGSFSNDMTTFHSADDVLTLLIHLGYLGYDYDNKSVFIPNKEIYEEFVNAVTVSEWGPVSRALKDSADTLQDIWNLRSDKVAAAIEAAHFHTSHISYNDENALSYTISLALYAAQNYYTIVREMPTGKGFADVVFVPGKKFPDKPALLVELKWNKSAAGAIAQIKERAYCKGLEDYKGNLLLVGINYDKRTKMHECIIEKLVYMSDKS